MGFLFCREFDWLSNLQLLNEDLVLWSWSARGIIRTGKTWKTTFFPPITCFVSVLRYTPLTVEVVTTEVLYR
jgi:hypothetical protein